jgi:hypothetical protein
VVINISQQQSGNQLQLATKLYSTSISNKKVINISQQQSCNQISQQQSGNQHQSATKW